VLTPREQHLLTHKKDIIEVWRQKMKPKIANANHKPEKSKLNSKLLSGFNCNFSCIFCAEAFLWQVQYLSRSLSVPVDHTQLHTPCLYNSFSSCFTVSVLI